MSRTWKLLNQNVKNLNIIGPKTHELEFYWTKMSNTWMLMHHNVRNVGIIESKCQKLGHCWTKMSKLGYECIKMSKFR